MSERSTANAIESVFSNYGKWSAGVGLALGTLSLGTPALAEDAAAAASAPPDAEKLKEVVVKATREAPAYKPENLSSPKFAQPLLDVPQSVTVVPKEILSEQNAQSLQDVLKNVPGITFTSGEGNLGWGDLFTIRGFSSEQSITVDGMRDAGMSSRNDTFNIEQVEVFKGTGSIESGTASVGGTVNLVSKEARLDNFYNLSAGVGSADYGRLTADLNKQIGDGAALRVNLMKHQNGVAGRDKVNFRREGVAVSLGLGLDTHTRFYVDAFHQEDNNVPDTGLPIQRGTGGQTMPYVPHSAWYGADSYMQHTQSDALTGKFEHDWSDNLKLRSQLRWEQSDNLQVLSPARFNAASADGKSLGTSLGYAGVGGLSAAAGIRSYTDYSNTSSQYAVLRGADYGTSKRYRILGSQTDLTVKFDTGVLHHELVTGLDLYRETYGDLQRTVMAPSGTLWFDLTNPSTSFTEVATVKGAAGVVSRVSNAGVYATDTIRITPQWRVLTALRYDHWRALTTTKGVTTADSSDGAVSGRASLMYKPEQDLNLYLAYAQAAQPSAMGATTNNAIYGSAAASSYDPATSKTAEAGAKWDVVAHRLSLTGALFRTSVSDSWEYGDTDTSPVRALPAKRVEGLELGLQGNITDAWSIYSGLARMNSKQTKGANAGTEAKNTPRMTFNLWTSYEAAKGLFLSYGAQYVGKRRYTDAKYVGGQNNNASTVSGSAGLAPVYVLDTEKAPEYWVSSAAARYRVNSHLALNLNVQNLFNKFYWSRIGSSLDGFQLYGVPGASRTVTLSADLSF
ncbi:TonB-dependent siderophore receptor [Duganella sp. FT80W]|uniref:TonB-dependent siderophore receptor n=1 Tax=Duganella guangzhouensis TaxID=2666084 RepID=A0A6I2KWJ4_9BURK|nr:TonB-dependent siderophore receptor [Duganella guangzhouensis]MRW89920.1 TonB-dependent siderophore receptor [Duganella guangzhouensis]